MYNKITDIFWRLWPYLVTGLLCVIGASAIYKGMGELFALVLIGVPSVIFLMRNPIYGIITQFCYSSIVLFFTDNLHVNGFIIYFTDILTTILLIQVIINFPQLGYKLRILAPPMLVWALIFTANIISSIYNHVSLFNFLWGMRLNYRFIVFMMACIMFIDRWVMDVIWKIFIVLICCQVVICSVQFFIFDYIQDAIGGTFGSHGTCLLVCFFAIAFLFVYLRFSEGESRLSSVWFVLIAELYVCAINEGKAAVLFNLVIFVVIVFQNGISLRKILWIIGGIASFVIFTRILGAIYPSFKNFFDIENLLNYTMNQSYFGSSINRFNGPQYFSHHLDSFQDLWGVGLGNAAESGMPLLQSDIYMRFGGTNYTWFYIAYYYLESGYIGLYLNYAFYLSFFVVAFRIRNKVSGNYLAFLIGMVLLCILSTGYFLALRSEVIGYTFYLFLSLPLAIAANDEQDYHYYATRLDKRAVIA